MFVCIIITITITITITLTITIVGIITQYDLDTTFGPPETPSEVTFKIGERDTLTLSHT
jgi:hypothetical protein